MIFKKIYNEAYLDRDTITIDGHRYEAVEGKHCIWIPELEIKIPWTFNGKIEARKDWDKGRNRVALMNQTFNDESHGWDLETLTSICDEYYLLEMISREQMSPKVNGYIYIENMISQYIRPALHCDSVGVIGYHIGNANKLVPGRYNFDDFKRIFLDGKQILASDGALGDLRKQGNTINGYLVDVRRTIWDMMEPGYDFVDQIAWLDMIPDPEELKHKILSLGQFPYGERKKAYQAYWLNDHYEDGTRQTLYRFDRMKIDKDLTGKTVIDLGSQIGSICIECYLRGARHITGIEYEHDYVECARDLARYNHHQINYQCMNLNNVDLVTRYLNDYYRGLEIDMVFLLSMYKHIYDMGFKILKGLHNWKSAYIESNNCPQWYQSKQAQEIEKYLNGYFGGEFGIERIGMTEDRSPRCLWKVERKQ